MNVFMTGATGFLGRRLLARLVDDEHHVTALVRSRSAHNWASSQGAEAVSGNFSDIPDWAPALEGQEVLVHCAAPVRFWGVWEEFERDIVKASVDLYRAAAQAGVRRFIYISSESVMQGSKPLLDVDADYECPGSTNSYYSRAKLAAERALKAETSGPELIILRPAFIWGVGMSVLDDIVDKIRSGQFTWVDQGRHPMEMVHVDNLVQAIVCALDHGQNGDCFLVTDGEASSVREFLGALLEARGVTAPQRSLPGWLVKPTAYFLHWLWESLDIVGTPPPVSRFDWAFVAQPRRYNIDKTRQILGYQPPVSREQGLAALRLEYARFR